MPNIISADSLEARVGEDLGFSDWVLVDQERQWVEVFRRHEGGWMQEIAAVGESVTLQSVGLTLSLAAIYEDSDVPELGVGSADQA